MRVYRLDVAERQQWILPTEDEDFERFFALDGTPVRDWSPPRMEFLDVDGNGEPRCYSDFPWLGSHAPIVRERARDRLTPLLLRYGEFLPLDCDEPVWLFNVTHVIDALDEEASAIVRFDDGDILDIERFVFRSEAIGEALVFKLPMRASCTFVTAPLVSRIGSLGLEGVRFELLWTAEPPGDAAAHVTL